MKERLTALLLALAALVLFWVMFFPKPQLAPDVARPLSTEGAPAGYLGLWRWLEAEGIPSLRLRQRFDSLTNAGLPQGSGHVLLSTMPHALPVRESEFADLALWIRRGNTVLIMAALDDTPRWSALASTDFLDQLRRIALIRFEPRPTAGDSALARAGALVRDTVAGVSPELVPVGNHPLLAGVKSLATSSDLPASQWLAAATDSAPVLALAKRSDTGAPVMWIRTLGAGSIIVSSYASPLSNGTIARSDNARWIANVIAWARSPQGGVIFDDVHQGATDFYDAAAFYADPRLHHSLWWIVAVWLIYVLGARPLRETPGGARPLDDTAMVRVSGRFLANVLRPAAAGKNLIEHFFNRLRRRLALPENGEPLWAWLGEQAAITPAQLSELKRLHSQADADLPIRLVQLQSLLSEISGRIK